MSKPALIIFIKNPEPGKVKTRIGKTLGDDKAVEIYKKLLGHTLSITVEVDADRYLYYGDYINWNDTWDTSLYYKRLQAGDDLGQRMNNAFAEVLSIGHTSAVIIGSDCLELTSEMILEALGALKDHGSVIGPTYDGGYYLLGMTSLLPSLFQNKNWSTDTVFADTKADIDGLGISCKVLGKLADMDEAQDVPGEWL